MDQWSEALRFFLYGLRQQNVDGTVRSCDLDLGILIFLVNTVIIFSIIVYHIIYYYISI